MGHSKIHSKKTLDNRYHIFLIFSQKISTPRPHLICIHLWKKTNCSIA